MNRTASRSTASMGGGLTAGLATIAMVLMLGACGGGESGGPDGFVNKSGPDTGMTDTAEGGGDGGSETGPGADTRSGDTRMPDGSADGGSDTDDGSGDVEMDGGRDGGEVGTPDDRDGDGVKNAEDNCPDTANANQIDRDRDDIGNPCDHYPYVHDPSNPKDLKVTQEDEANNPNDDARDGEDYGLELPFIVEGEIGPIEDDGDLDYYSFEIDEPTALLLRIEPRTTRFWPGGITFGYEARNGNIQTVSLGSGNDEVHTREMFLPAPGKYSIAVSDLRNLLPDGQTSDVDGSKNDYKYRVTLGKIPLPKPRQPMVPSKHSEKWPGRLRTWKIDAKNLDALKVTAKGVSVGMNQATHHPALMLWDPDEKRVLSHTILQQVDTDRQLTELTAKLDKQFDEVVVIEDIVRRYGNATTIVEFAEPKSPVDSEFETVKKQQDERVGRHVWLQPGQSVEGTINAPWTAGASSLEADNDYYLMNVRRGQAVRVTLEPKMGSQFKGDLRLGNYLVQNNGGSNFYEPLGHRSRPAEKTGQTRSVEFIYTDKSEGEVAIQVRHAPNNGSDNPVGGSNYGYRLKVETFTPSPVDMDMLSMLPGEANIADGGTGVFKFTANQGDLLILDGEEPGGFDERIRLIRKNGWKQLRRAYDPEVTFMAPKTGTYWYDARDDDGGGTPAMEPFKLTIRKANATQVQSLPTKINGTLADGDDVKFYRFKTGGAANLDFRLRTSNFRSRVDVYKAPNFNRVAISYQGGEVTHVDGPTELVVKVSSRNDKGGAFTLGIQEIMPTALGSLPAQVSGAIDDEPFPAWFKASVSKGEGYKVAFQKKMGAGFNSRMEVYRADNMNRLEVEFGNALRFRAPKDGVVYIALFDQDQRGDPSYKFDLQMETLPTTPLTVGQPAQGQLADGSDRMLYTFSGGPGLIDVDVTAKGPWTPQVKLLDGDDFDVNHDPEGWRGVLRYPTYESNSYGLLVKARDGNRSGPLKFDVSVDVRPAMSTVSEMEPNNSTAKAQKIGGLPAVVDASLGNSGDGEDRFALDLKSGQRVWAMVAPQSRSQRFAMIPRIQLLDPSDNNKESDLADGAGNWPAMYAERADSSGTWVVRMKRRNGGRSGDYYLYLYTSAHKDVAESEPNDSQMAAQDLGTFDAASAHIAATVDGSDATDVYKFQLTRDLDELRMFLEGGAAGYGLRLLDANFMEIANGGSGAANTPDFKASGLKAGTYYLELTHGAGAGGAVDVVMWATP